jgi:hypothetical protein
MEISGEEEKNPHQSTPCETSPVSKHILPKSLADSSPLGAWAGSSLGQLIYSGLYCLRRRRRLQVTADVASSKART